jgi:glycosyltransferase involved in cell wall biosynthesis
LISKKKVYYWSPHVNSQVATVKSVLNSALSFRKFSNDEFDVKIINVFGEWNKYRDLLTQNNIQIEDLYNFKIKLPINGFVKSRLFYIAISIISIFKIFRIVKKNSPDFFIAHLIVTPVLFVSRFLKSDTKYILRISGYPILNNFRSLFWRFLGKNLFAITCPTVSTMNRLINRKIFLKKNIFLLNDPIFRMHDFSDLRKKTISANQKYILSVGRLTKQKNFSFLIKNFSKISIQIPDCNLLIIGSGEEREKLEDLIKKLNMQKRIKIMNYQANIYRFYLNADLFVLTSLWEDPGFVILEAAMNNLLILSSDCPNGPREFIKNEFRGFSFKSNDDENFRNKLMYVLKNLNNEEFFEKKLMAKKYCRQYTIYNHFNSFLKILDNS